MFPTNGLFFFSNGYSFHKNYAKAFPLIIIRVDTTSDEKKLIIHFEILPEYLLQLHKLNNDTDDALLGNDN